MYGGDRLKPGHRTRRLKLPHVAFNRRVGALAGIEATPDGEMISADEWQRRKGEWLPTDDDRSYVATLQKPVYEAGKIANWIGKPARGIKGLPFEYEYVRLD